MLATCVLIMHNNNNITYHYGGEMMLVVCLNALLDFQTSPQALLSVLYVYYVSVGYCAHLGHQMSI